MKDTLYSLINNDSTKEMLITNILKSSINNKLQKNNLLTFVKHYIDPSNTLLILADKDLGIKKFREDFLKQFCFEFQTI